MVKKGSRTMSIGGEEIARRVAELRAEEKRELQKGSEPLHKLTVYERFTVDDVTCNSYPTGFTPQAERVFGGTSSVYQGGFTTRLTLTVTPDKSDVPVRTLKFEGYSAVRAGDIISAGIPRYTEKELPSAFFLAEPGETFFYDREFGPQETAVELQILSPEGTVLRSDRAVDYDKFVKPEK